MNDNVPPANEKVELQRPTTGKGPGGLANFPPEYFAMVMATGIVSLAARDIGWDLIARALVWINTAAFIMLWVIAFARFIYYRSRFINDLTHHSHSAAFLTMVAAACILGCQFVELYGWSSVAKYLWYSGIGLWVILNY
ncbi:MAG: C4-dicarboxylate ABC transporter, partial [Limisphaerales bacterium]